MHETTGRRGRPRRFLCPPSGEKVLQVLDGSHAPLDPTQLQGKTGLPRRTMYFALECLHRVGLVRAGTTLSDTRRARYALDPEHRDGRWHAVYGSPSRE